MQDLTELIKALAALAWPLLTLYVFWSLRPELAKLIGRVRRGKILGQELELDQQLDQLTVAVETAKQELPETANAAIAEQNSQIEREAVLGDRPGSPLATFLRVSRALELAATNVLLRTGWSVGGKKLSVLRAFKHMPAGWVSDDVMESIALFSKIRNRIVHGNEPVSDDEILRATELGFELLDVVRNYPIEENRVRGKLIPLFSDPDALTQIEGVRGIRLTSIHPKKAQPAVRIFPTTRDWFGDGQLVSWEWELSRVWGPTWFRDPETGDVKKAWDSAGEFVGRPLDEPDIPERH